MKLFLIPLFVLLAIAAFSWLAWYSLPVETSYSASQRASMSRLVASVQTKHLNAENRAKLVYLYGQKEEE